MAYEIWNARGRRGAAAQAAPQARPRRPPSGQLEELFADWHRALWAIDFFKTRRSESVMRSFREIVFRADARRPRGLAGARHGHRGGPLSWSAPALPVAGPSGRRAGLTWRRSSAYWAANRYADEAEEPAPAAPLNDLPAAGRGALPRCCGRACWRSTASPRRCASWAQSWRWAWEYGVGNRKLCWVHVIGDALSATFTLSDGEEDRLGRAGRVPADICAGDRRRPAHRPGQVVLARRWTTAARSTRSSASAARKAEWLARAARAAARPAAARAPARPAMARGCRLMQSE